MTTPENENIRTNGHWVPDEGSNIQKSSLPDFGYTPPFEASLPDFGLNTIPPPPQREYPQTPMVEGHTED